jgi:predicted outer membrane protein
MRNFASVAAVALLIAGAFAAAEEPAQPPEWRAELLLKLTKPVSFEVTGSRVADAAVAAGKAEGVSVVIDPRIGDLADAKVTFRATKLRLDLALKWVVKLAGLAYEFRDGAVFVSTRKLLDEDAAARPVAAVDPDEAVRRRLAKKVSVEFDEAPLREAVDYFQSLAKGACIIDPALDAEKKVTLTVEDKPMSEALSLIAAKCGMDYVVKDEAVLFTTPFAAAIIRSPSPGPVRPPKRDEPEWLWKGTLGAVSAKTAEKPVSMEFVDIPVEEAINFISTLRHVSMMTDPRPGAALPQGPITLKISDMRLENAIKWVLRLAGLDYTLAGEAIFISTPERVREVASCDEGPPGKIGPDRAAGAEPGK